MGACMVLLYAPAYSKIRISSIVKSKYYLPQVSLHFQDVDCIFTLSVAP